MRNKEISSTFLNTLIEITKTKTKLRTPFKQNQNKVRRESEGTWDWREGEDCKEMASWATAEEAVKRVETCECEKKGFVLVFLMSLVLMCGKDESEKVVEVAEIDDECNIFIFIVKFDWIWMNDTTTIQR